MTSPRAGSLMSSPVSPSFLTSIACTGSVPMSTDFTSPLMMSVLEMVLAA
jgi:hypothetical protein